MTWYYFHKGVYINERCSKISFSLSMNIIYHPTHTIILLYHIIDLTINIFTIVNYILHWLLFSYAILVTTCPPPHAAYIYRSHQCISFRCVFVDVCLISDLSSWKGQHSLRMNFEKETWRIENNLQTHLIKTFSYVMRICRERRYQWIIQWYARGKNWRLINRKKVKTPDLLRHMHRYIF